MNLLTILLIVLGVLVMLAAVAWWLWRTTPPRGRDLAKRVTRLPLRRKLSLAGAVWRDERIPFRARAVLPGMVLYLALPLDIVPDFIPVLGQLDDLIVLVFGVAILLRSAPLALLEEHVTRLEAATS